METDVCFFGKSSATHPSHTKTADVGFWLFPRAKVVRMFFKSKEKNDVTDFSRLLRRVTNSVTDFSRNRFPKNCIKKAPCGA